MAGLSKFLIKCSAFPEFRTTSMNYSTDGNLAAETSMLQGGSIAQQIGAKDGSQIGSWVGATAAVPVLRKDIMNMGDMLETAIKGRDSSLVRDIQQNAKTLLEQTGAKTTTGRVAGLLTRKKLGHMILAGKLLPTPIAKAALKTALVGFGGSGLGYLLGGLAGHYAYKD